VIWSAAYLLWMYQRVFYGPIHHDENRAVPDIGAREQISLWPLAVMAVVMGVASPLFMKSIDGSVGEINKKEISSRVGQGTERDTKRASLNFGNSGDSGNYGNSSLTQAGQK